MMKMRMDGAMGVVVALCKIIQDNPRFLLVIAKFPSWPFYPEPNLFKFIVLCSIHVFISVVLLVSPFRMPICFVNAYVLLNVVRG